MRSGSASLAKQNCLPGFGSVQWCSYWFDLIDAAPLANALYIYLLFPEGISTSCARQQQTSADSFPKQFVFQIYRYSIWLFGKRDCVRRKISAPHPVCSLWNGWTGTVSDLAASCEKRIVIQLSGTCGDCRVLYIYDLVRTGSIQYIKWTMSN